MADKIKRYADLKQIIDSATGELKMIEGDIKGVGKDLFMKEYRQQKSTPDNFKIQDETGNTYIMLIVATKKSDTCYSKRGYQNDME